MSLFAYDMILYIENSKGTTKKILEVKSEFSRDKRYIINSQKFMASLYTNNKLCEKKIKKIIPFIIASKRIKDLGINLTNGLKILYIENTKILMKEIVEDKNKWKDTPCS